MANSFILQKSSLRQYINKWPGCVPVNFVYNRGLANPRSRVLIFDWILEVNQRKLLARGLLMPRGCLGFTYLHMTMQILQDMK